MIVRTRTSRLVCPAAIVAALLAFSITAVFAGEDSAKLAQQALAQADMHGGLIVYLGCTDANFCAALHCGSNDLVQGLATDARQVEAAREQLQKQGVYGPVSVSHFDGQHLPYADNVVNLIVADSLGNVSHAEAMRALAPEGKLCLKDAQGQWQVSVKPRPSDIDVWTHFLHDASGNAVAHDDKVAPPGALQWSEGPIFTRSHEHMPSIYALVSNGPRIFYIADQAPLGSILHMPSWQLVARDAFNGILLWQKPITTWYPHLINWGSTPANLEDRLVSEGNRVYVTMGWHAPLSALDTATGETVRVYEKTEGTEEVLYHQGVLLLLIRSVTEARHADEAKWTKLIQDKTKSLYDKDKAKPLVSKLGNTESQGAVSLVAIDAESGRQLWKKDLDKLAKAKKTAANFCADGDQVYYQAGPEVVCVSLKTGEKKWSQTQQLRLAQGDNVVCAGDETAAVLSAKTGKVIWQASHQLGEAYDVFLAGGSVWIGGFKPFPQNPRGSHWGPYFAVEMDLKTGKILKNINPDNPSHHHRCYRNKATDRYILGGRRGTEFLDLQTGDISWNSWARGLCKYGVMPCNGLLYVPPHACACYMAAKLTGFNVMAARRPLDQIPTAAPVVEKGPAFSQWGVEYSQVADSEWPMYRHDVDRSGATTTQVPAQLHLAWQTEVGPRVTSPTIARDGVFTASVEQHKICALNPATGKPVWQYTAGGRVDSSPTIVLNRAQFGCRDGWLYSVNTTDGKLAWRTRLAGEERRIVSGGQIESVSPSSGSVIYTRGTIYATAGRSTYLDSGINLFRVDPSTGKVLSKTPIYSPDPKTGEQPVFPASKVLGTQHNPTSAFILPGEREDLLSANGKYVYLRDMVFGQDGQISDQGNPHLFAMIGFLDDSWAHRDYWIYGTQCSVAGGCMQRTKDLVYGRIMSLTPAAIYGYGRKEVHWSNALQDGSYRLFAMDRASGKTTWEKPLPIQVRAMVATRDILFVAGPPNGTSAGPNDPGEGKPSLLLAVSMADGSVLAKMELPGTPIFDGMAAADHQLYAAMENGSIICLK